MYCPKVMDIHFPSQEYGEMSSLESIFCLRKVLDSTIVPKFQRKAAH